MAEDIKIEQIETQPTVEVGSETRLWKVPKVLAASFAAASAYIARTGAERAGMPLARYLEIDWEAMRNKGAFGQLVELLVKRQKMRAGLPVTKPVESGDAVVAGEIAAGRYVTAIHRGAYHKVGESYRRIVDWAAANDVDLGDNAIEWYIDDPGEMPTKDVRTRILIPVRE